MVGDDETLTVSRISVRIRELSSPTDFQIFFVKRCSVVFRNASAKRR